MIKTFVCSAVDAVNALKQISEEVPSAAVVLGSGVKVLDHLDQEQQISYDQVFGVSPGVAGHAGTVSLGRVAGKLIAVLRGRFHLYEGYDWDLVTLPVRVLVEWGVPHLYLTNAAGGLNPQFQVGDLMLIIGYRDHLHPKLKESGLIPSMKQPPVNCQNELTRHIYAASQKLAAQDKNFKPLRTGIYAASLGPNYETIAETEMLRRLKVDTVGMSTVPEIEAAFGTNTRAAALSVVTNVWQADANMEEGHKEVLEAAKHASEYLDKLLRTAIS